MSLGLFAHRRSFETSHSWQRVLFRFSAPVELVFKACARRRLHIHNAVTSAKLWHFSQITLAAISSFNTVTLESMRVKDTFLTSESGARNCEYVTGQRAADEMRGGQNAKCAGCIFHTSRFSKFSLAQLHFSVPLLLCRTTQNLQPTYFVLSFTPKKLHKDTVLLASWDTPSSTLELHLSFARIKRGLYIFADITKKERNLQESSRLQKIKSYWGTDFDGQNKRSLAADNLLFPGSKVSLVS